MNKYFPENELPLIDCLQKLYPDSSNTTLRSLLSTGRVTVDGAVIKKGQTLVSPGNEVQIAPLVKKALKRLPILFKDQHLIIVNKPAGLLSVSTDFETEETAHALLKKEFYPRKVYTVHRLDKDTSGVMVFAFSEKTRDLLKKIFEKHAIERIYNAIVEGVMEEKEGTFRSYLYEDKNYYVHTTSDPKIGVLAITHYRVLEIKNNFTYLELKLETGKKNQIRVQCRHAGHPCAGDDKYGAKTNPLKRLCLHAKFLSFTHPITNKKVSFSSPPPKAFETFKGRKL